MGLGGWDHGEAARVGMTNLRRLGICEADYLGHSLQGGGTR